MSFAGLARVAKSSGSEISPWHGPRILLQGSRGEPCNHAGHAALCALTLLLEAAPGHAGRAVRSQRARRRVLWRACWACSRAGDVGLASGILRKRGVHDERLAPRSGLGQRGAEAEAQVVAPRRRRRVRATGGSPCGNSLSSSAQT